MPHISVGWETWAVLGFSFAVDGVVFAKAFRELRARAEEEGSPMLRYLITMKDPFLLAVLLEDFCGTVGVLLAAAGIGLTQVTGNVLWDSIASIAIGGMLGAVALTLVRTNQRFLLGQSVEKSITSDIKAIILARPAVERVYEVQSQWLGPASFSYKVGPQGEVVVLRRNTVLTGLCCTGGDLRCRLRLTSTAATWRPSFTARTPTSSLNPRTCARTCLSCCRGVYTPSCLHPLPPLPKCAYAGPTVRPCAQLCGRRHAPC